MRYTAQEKTREKLAKLREVIAGARKPLILIYSNPDPDALASAWALREVMHAGGVSASIGYTGEIGRLENETMLYSLRIPASPIKEEAILEADLIALVDCQPEFFKETPLPRYDVIIDHHPKKKNLKAPFMDVRPSCLATSSMLTEYLRESKAVVGKRLATALYYGIKTDSMNSQRGPTPTDREALYYLEKKIDRNRLRKIEFSAYSLSRLDYFSIALVKLRYSRNALYSNVGPVSYSDVCVQIADFLIRVKEANWAVVSGVARGHLIIVFRCDGNRKNAGVTARDAFGSMGSAGGHRTMARAEIPAEALPEGIELTQNEKLERFVLATLAKVEGAFRPLVRSLLP